MSSNRRRREGPAAPWRDHAASACSLVVTSKRLNSGWPNAVEMATSAASRPRAMTMRPIRAVVAGVERVPAPAQKDFEPGAEVHRRRVGRNADVAEIAGAIARRDVHAAAERDRQMGEIAADADALAQPVGGGAARVRASRSQSGCRSWTKSQIACTRVAPPPISQRTATRPSRRDYRCRNSGLPPGTREPPLGQLRDRRQRSVERRLVGRAAVANGEIVVKRHQSRGASSRVTRLPNRS